MKYQAAWLLTGLCALFLSGCWFGRSGKGGIIVLENDSNIPARASRTDLMGKQTKDGPGGRISLIIAGADLKNALTTIAQLGQINVSVDREVWGENIKARFINVPWDLALAALLQSHNLSIKKVGSIYRIGPRDKLSQERDSDGLGGDVGRENIKTHFIKLKKAPAAEVAPVVKELLLSPWGSVIPYAPANLLIVRDEDRVIVRIKEFVQRLEANQKGS